MGFAELRGARVLLVSHQLDISGSPLFLTELGGEMVRCGASVSLVNLHARLHCERLALRHGVRLCSLDASFKEASRADLILANTAVAKHWVRDALAHDAAIGRRLIWWIHEIDTDRYRGGMESSDRVAAMLFDSRASLERWQSAGLRLPPLHRVIHLSVSDEFIAAADRTHFTFDRSTLWRRLGLPSAPQSRNAIRARLGVGRNDVVAALFAYYSAIKGQDLFVRTIGRLLEQTPMLPIKALLVGFTDRDRGTFLRRLTPIQRRATGDRLRVCRVTENLWPFYAASDVYVMNSQGPGENFGRVTTEAMAFRLPVLGTDIGGTPEIVVDGVTGLLYPPGENGQERLAAHIRQLVADRGLARRMGLAGRARVCEYFSRARFFSELRPVVSAVRQAAQR